MSDFGKRHIRCSKIPHEGGVRIVRHDLDCKHPTEHEEQRSAEARCTEAVSVSCDVCTEPCSGDRVVCGGCLQIASDLVKTGQRRSEATPCGRFHVHPAEWDALIELARVAQRYHALIELARVAQRYHDETGHGTPGATAQCDPICEALKAWRKAANPDG